MKNQTGPKNLSNWPDEDLEAVTRCPVCGSERREALHRGLTDRVFFCAPGTWDLFRCMGCNSAYLDPRPTPASIGRAYSRYFTHSGKWREAPEDLSPLRKVLRALSNGYFNHRFGTDFTPAHPPGAWLALLAPWKRGELESAGRHLPKAEPGQTLLDVGCGNGIFLEFARRAGWQAQGIDFDAEAVACCTRKGLNVKVGGIDALCDQAECFDWITLSHVIEHVHDPLAVLRACHRLLKPGGRAAVIVPDGVLFGSSKAHKELRRMLVEDQKLDAVVKLPGGVFRPYAGVSTAILLFTKTNSGGTDQVWFYDVEADGWSLDDKRSPLLPEDKLGPVPRAALGADEHGKNNLPDVLARWAARNGAERERPRTAQSFCVPKADIATQGYDLALNRYKEVVHEAIEHRAPQELLADLAKLEEEIQRGMKELEGMLK